MCIDSKEIIVLLPELEAYISGQRATDEDRRRFARGSNCLVACDRGISFLRLAGIQGVRREVHYGDKMGHTILLFTNGKAKTELSLDDQILDPTYLQFANMAVDLSNFPNTFLGTRADVIKLMSDASLVNNREAPHLYQQSTWIPGKS